MHKLAYKGFDVARKFYFLTAYPSRDELRNAEEIKTLIDFEQFSSENLIEKGNEKDFDRLRHIIENIDILKLQNENMKFIFDFNKVP